MKKRIKILIISNEVWNDEKYGNNILSNWFEGMNAEFANIYCEAGAPDNKCCKKYFQITDTMMLKSIFSNRKAGKKVNYLEKENKTYIVEQEPEHLYHFLKIISGSLLRLVRELIWLIGKYDVNKLKIFIEEFNPDVIFSERMASCKILKLEKIIHSLNTTPFLAFTGDDEYSLRQLNLSPFFWINRFMIRKRLKENVKFYKIYYTLSLEQSVYYKRIFGCRSDVLQKCGSFDNVFKNREIERPIKLIYAGKLYCNRWKALADISKAISAINSEHQKMILHIYTKDRLNAKQNKLLNDGYNSVVIGAIDQTSLKEKYKEYDLALHVEARDIKNRLATRFSYSTKIIDCLFSGCAVLAYCWKEHSGLTSLAREDSTICVSTYKDLLMVLSNIDKNPGVINEYRKKAYINANRYHNKEKIQTLFLSNIIDAR